MSARIMAEIMMLYMDDVIQIEIEGGMRLKGIMRGALGSHVAFLEYVHVKKRGVDTVMRLRAVTVKIECVVRFIFPIPFPLELKAAVCAILSSQHPNDFDLRAAGQPPDGIHIPERVINLRGAAGHGRTTRELFEAFQGLYSL